MPSPLGARKDDQWIAMCCAPSPNWTGVGPIRVVVPYQVYSPLIICENTASRVLFNGKPACTVKSTQPHCLGDAPGAMGGLRSGVVGDEVKPISRGRVKINGQSVLREGDPCTLNKGNCEGKYRVMAPPPPASQTRRAKKKKYILVDMLTTQTYGLEDKPVTLTAIADPKGGTFKWTCAGYAKLVNDAGKESGQGERMHVKVIDNAHNDEPVTEVRVTVSYSVNGETVDETQMVSVVNPSVGGAASNALRKSFSKLTLDVGHVAAGPEREWKTEDAAERTGGFRVVGTGSPVANRVQNSRQELSIVVFIDGTGNSHSGGSNISQMYDSVWKHTGPWPDDARVNTNYFYGPGAMKGDYAGAVMGTFSWVTVEEAYERVVRDYVTVTKNGYTKLKVDIYGFSRGAAIANELAWKINEEGIKLDKDTVRVPSGKLKVRFLGLYETVHSMGLPGKDSSADWHDKTIAPCVENCAVAFAADERRTYFLPSVLTRDDSDKGAPIKELIFPGVHSDVGGHNDNNHYIMALTRSWMSEQATKAGVPYLKQHIIPEWEFNALKSDPEKMKPGAEGYPKFLEVNPLWVAGHIPPTSPFYFAERIADESVAMVFGHSENNLRNALGKNYPPPGQDTNPFAYFTEGERRFAEQPVEMHKERDFTRYKIPRLIPKKMDVPSTIDLKHKRADDSFGTQA